MQLATTTQLSTESKLIIKKNVIHYRNYIYILHISYRSREEQKGSSIHWVQEEIWSHKYSVLGVKRLQRSTFQVNLHFQVFFFSLQAQCMKNEIIFL